jgi:DNA-binding Lrp family transcriptional regulator
MHILSMDAFDVKILDALQRDARLTNNELAEAVGLSPSQCSRRRTQLEEDGAIRGYHAALDQHAMGFGVVAFVQVTLATHSPDNSRRFQQLIERIDEVQECFAVTGEADYLVKLVARDLPGLAGLLNDIFLPHEAVAHVRSSIALTTLKDQRLFPIRANVKPVQQTRAGIRPI